MATDIPLAPRDPEAAPVLYNADASGNTYLNKNDRVIIVVQNNHTTDDLVVSVIEQVTCGHKHHLLEQGLIAKTLTVPSGGVGLFGPFQRSAFNDRVTNKVLLNYSFVLEGPTQVVGVAALIDKETSR